MKVRAKRSLKASAEGIKRANKAVLKYPTKIDLAAEIEISRATVQNFFAQKAISRENFHKICQKLELPWQEIALLAEEPTTQSPQTTDLDTLVQQWRQQQHPYIEHSCSHIKVLDMSQPKQIETLYTQLDIYEKISNKRRLEIAQLQSLSTESPQQPQRLPQENALHNYKKLLVLGAPGCGKTTFLKHIAWQCSQGQLYPHLVPLFIVLNDWIPEPQLSLKTYITQHLSNYQPNPLLANSVQQLLTAGRALILLDGLDRVAAHHQQRARQEIRNFSNRFPTNRIVLTSRFSSGESSFEQFSEVEIAQFNEGQIRDFVTKWFAAIDTTKSSRFLHKLQQEHGIQELATNPLLLTLMCLMFEEARDFPSNRVELYQEAIELLLKKWQNQHQEYQLSLQHQQDLLSHIAYLTFQQGEHFFTHQQLLVYIADYLDGLSGAYTQSNAQAEFDTESILNVIVTAYGLLVEKAKGIYGFSHLTFQEYFAARHIVNQIVKSDEPQVLATVWQNLRAEIILPRWREVFLLTVEMLPNPDALLLLMHQHLQRFVLDDSHLQAFLKGLSAKSLAVNVSYKSVAVRLFYLALERMLALVSDRFTLDNALVLVDSTFETALKIDPNLMFIRNLDPDLALDHALTLALAHAIYLNHALELDSNSNLELDLALALELNLTYGLDLAINHSSETQLESQLIQLEFQLPNPEAGSRKFRQWWKTKGKSWTNKLMSVMVSYRNIGYIWQFSDQQREALNNYYHVTRLLIDCLNSYCGVSDQVRQEIEEGLFLPISR